jgi:hypothetical protein
MVENTYAEIFIDALLCTIYADLTGEAVEKSQPIADLLEMVGLKLRWRKDGFEIRDIDSQAVLSEVSWTEDRQTHNFYVEPAELVFRAMRYLNQPINFSQ